MRIFWKGATDAKSQIRTLSKAREHIEIYLECCVRTLERKSGRIMTSFLKNLLFQIKISRFLTTRSTEFGGKGVHWVELVEFYLESERESWKAAMGELRQFYKIWCIFEGFFDGFCRFLEFGDVWCRNKVVKSMELLEFYLECCYLGWKVKWSESFQEILESWSKISYVRWTVHFA